jgi:transposase
MEIFTPPDVKEKRPPGRRAKHSPEYRAMVARKCVEDGMSYREAAKIFNLSHGSVHAIIQQYRDQGAKTKRNVQTSKYKQEVEDYRHKSQVKDLKLEIADLYLENLMLKKALEHSLQKKNDSSSVITSENLDQLKEAVK